MLLICHVTTHSHIVRESCEDHCQRITNLLYLVAKDLAGKEILSFQFVT